MTPEEVAALRPRLWCSGCHEPDLDKLGITRLLSAGYKPTLVCSACLAAWYDGRLTESGQRCERGPDCPGCSADAKEVP